MIPNIKSICSLLIRVSFSGIFPLHGKVFFVKLHYAPVSREPAQRRVNFKKYVNC
jgi:hypothetical protein